MISRLLECSAVDVKYLEAEMVCLVHWGCAMTVHYEQKMSNLVYWFGMPVWKSSGWFCLTLIATR